jgi:hypothetical protein
VGQLSRESTRNSRRAGAHSAVGTYRLGRYYVRSYWAKSRGPCTSPQTKNSVCPCTGSHVRGKCTAAVWSDSSEAGSESPLRSAAVSMLCPLQVPSSSSGLARPEVASAGFRPLSGFTGVVAQWAIVNLSPAGTCRPSWRARPRARAGSHWHLHASAASCYLKVPARFGRSITGPRGYKLRLRGCSRHDTYG